jgi:IclR family transcriptional regulator, KDG regulon repressor
LRNGEGRLVGAIGVIAPSVRLTRARMAELVPDVKECALNISRELGYRY